MQYSRLLLRRFLVLFIQVLFVLHTIGSQPSSSTYVVNLGRYVFYSSILHAHHRTTAEESKSIVDKEPTSTDPKARMAAALEYAKKKREKEGKAPLAEFKTMSQEQRKPEEETRAE